MGGAVAEVSEGLVSTNGPGTFSMRLVELLQGQLGCGRSGVCAPRAKI